MYVFFKINASICDYLYVRGTEVYLDMVQNT
jgi:hypothetical protein